MAILGKKYPLNKEEWRAARLPGQFDPKRAGKRMALSVPETWETQVLFIYVPFMLHRIFFIKVALHGNKASVWEGLVEKKKLPYLAGVRNLRYHLSCSLLFLSSNSISQEYHIGRYFRGNHQKNCLLHQQ